MIKIDPEFKSLLRSQSPSERAELEASIMAEGCRDPLVCWGDILLDGHNRLEICTKLHVFYTTVQAPGVTTRKQALEWILRNQLARRNLSPVQRVLYASQFAKTPNECAVLADVPSATVSEIFAVRDRGITAVVDALVLGTIGVHRAYEITRKPRAEQETIAANGFKIPRIAERTRRTAQRLEEEHAKQAVVDPLDARRASARAAASESAARRDLKLAVERLEALEATLKGYEQFTAEPIVVPPPAVLHRGLRPAAAVALLSDVHAEERVFRTEAIDNEYSLAIAQRRVARFFAAVHWLVQHAQAHDFAIDDLVIWLGGDLISGDIHEELLQTCEVPPGEAVQRIRGWLTGGLRTLLAALPDIHIRVPCSYGNHSRTTQRMRASTGYGHSWEWALYQDLGREFAEEPRVQIHSTRDEMQYVEVLDFTLAFHHGHRMRYKGGIGGVTIPAIKAVHRWQAWRDCDYYNFGHFHERLDLGQIAFNGSVIGPSPYGLSIGARPERPQQSFYVLDAKRGKTMCCPIWVEE